MIVNVYLVNCCFMFASGWAEGGGGIYTFVDMIPKLIKLVFNVSLSKSMRFGYL